MAELSYAERILLAAALKKPDEKPNYYELLGKFITAYARAEIQVHVLARKYTGAKDTQARILLHRLGLTKVTDLVRELGQSHLDFPLYGLLGSFIFQSEYDDVDACLSQLAVISSKRGDLVHRSSIMEDDGFHISNFQTAKKLQQFEQGIITKNDLEAMTLDCGMIFLYLSQIANPIPDFLFGRPQSGAWRYRPPQPAPQKAEKKMKPRKERKLRRAASRAK